MAKRGRKRRYERTLKFYATEEMISALNERKILTGQTLSDVIREILEMELYGVSE